MCLGVPGAVVQRYEKDGLPMAKVDFGGAAKEVCLSLTPEAVPGQYVLVHVGFALSVVDEDEARQIFESLGQLEEAAEQERREIDERRNEQGKM
jgi:hydrogenase expression/formation protein HypC